MEELKKREREGSTHKTLFEDPFTEQELKMALKERKSPGPDKFQDEMLTNLGPFVRKAFLFTKGCVHD